MNVDVPRPDDRHPLDVELVAYADGELEESKAVVVAAHVSGCDRCSSILRNLSDPVAGDIHVDEVDFDVTQNLPSLFATEVVGEPSVGELWHLEWGDAALVALVLDADVDRYLVAAVTAEAPAEPGPTIEIPETANRLTLYVWPALRRTVPLGVFNRPVGDQVPTDVVTAALTRGFESASDWSTATRLADLLARLDQLSEATWIPVVAEEPVILGDLVRARGLRPSALAQLSGVPAGAITELVRGVRQATPDEAARLAATLDVPAVDLGQPVSIPRALARAIDRPVHRAAIRLRALHARVTEAAARLDLAETVLAMPARTAHAERDVDAWDQLVRHQLDG